MTDTIKKKLRDLAFFVRCQDQMEQHDLKALFVNEQGRKAAVTLAECKAEIRNINHDLMQLKTTAPAAWLSAYKRGA
jgi:hypothetical protein